MDPVRVLLVKCSDLHDTTDSDWPKTPPLGLMYVSAALKAWSERPVETRIVNREMLCYTGENLEQIIEEFRPDIVGLSATTSEADNARTVAVAACERLPGVKTIVGGPHGTVYPEEVTHGGIDISVIGEGERTIVELVEALASGGDLREITGIAFMENGEFVKTAPREPIMDLDSLPFPDWDAVDLSLYAGTNNFMHVYAPDRTYMSVFTSRGCPYRCIFCHNIYGKKFRMRSAKNVLEELDILHEKYGVREILFVDDIFNLDGDRLEAICNGLVERGKPLALSFPNALRGDILTPHQMYKLIEAGTYYVAFSLETGSDRTLEVIRKKLNRPRAMENLHYLHDKGILTGCFLMIGFPTETKFDMYKTVKLAEHPDIDLPYIFTTIPQYGTHLYEMAKEMGKLPEPGKMGEFHYSTMGLNCSAAGEEDFKRLRILAVSAETRKMQSPELKARLEGWGLNFMPFDRTKYSETMDLDQAVQLSLPASGQDQDESTRIEEAPPPPNPAFKRMAMFLGKLKSRGPLKDGWGLEEIETQENQIQLTLAPASGSKPLVVRVLPRSESPAVARSANFNFVYYHSGSGEPLPKAMTQIGEFVIRLLARADDKWSG